MKKVAHGDFLLFILVIGLILFGVIMVYSASFYGTITNDDGPYAYLIRSGVAALGGIALFVGLRYLPYRFYYYCAPVALVVGVILLALLFTPLGDPPKDDDIRRWLHLGGITLMPGEIIKLCLIFFVAAYYTKFADKVRTLKIGYLPIMVIAVGCFLLINEQPNLSTAIIVFMVVVLMAFFAGVNFTYILITVCVGVVGVAIKLLSNPNGYQLKRITGYLNPFEDAQGDFYQLVQSLLALGAGGVHGVGPGKSVQKALYLPEAQTDFIFAVFGEEYGFIGCVALIMVFMLLIWKCAIISINAPDRFGMLLGSGVTVMLALQVIMNIGVVTGIVPPTGVALPFISYGGNAMAIFAASMGVLMNISCKTAKLQAGQNDDEISEKKKEKKKRKLKRKEEEIIEKVRAM